MSDNPSNNDGSATPVDNAVEAVNNGAVNKTALEQLVVKPPTACGINITERAHEMNKIMLEGARLGIQAALW